MHDELGPIALAVVKRSTPTDEDLTVRTADGTVVAAGQQVLVPPTAGHAHRPPRLPRLGAVSAPRRPPRSPPPLANESRSAGRRCPAASVDLLLGCRDTRAAG